MGCPSVSSCLLAAGLDPLLHLWREDRQLCLCVVLVSESLEQEEAGRGEPGRGPATPTARWPSEMSEDGTGWPALCYPSLETPVGFPGVKQEFERAVCTQETYTTRLNSQRLTAVPT